MKARLMLLFLFLLLVPVMVTAENHCKYTKTEEYSEIDRMLVYEGTTTKGGEDLIFSEFSGGKVATFAIKNPNPFRIMVILNFTIEGTGAKNIQYGKYIDANDSEQVREVCKDGENLGECSIKQDSLQYYVEKPDVMYPKDVEVKKTRIVCPPPGNPCSANMDCGSGFCVRGICSTNEFCYENNCRCNTDEVQCSDNKRCVTKDSVEVGSQPICSAEECKTGYINENGLCDESPIEQWTYIKIIIGIISVGFSGIYLYSRIKIRFIRKESQRFEELKKKIREEREEIEQTKREVINLKKEIEAGKNKIIELKRDIENAEGEAKKVFEEKLLKEEETHRARISSLENKNADLNLKEKKHRERELALKKKEEELQEKGATFLINEALDKYKQRYGNNIYFDENTGYIKFKDSNEYLHRYLYGKNFGLRSGHHIHHIDANKLNNELWNLIEIPEESHKRLIHARVIFKDWNSGIQQLKEQLGMKNKDFPEHIRNHLDKKSNETSI